MIAGCWKTGYNRIGHEAIPLPVGEDERDTLGGRMAWRIPKRGDLVLHYKGGYYIVLGTASDSSNDRAGLHVVIYYSIAKKLRHVRELQEFCGLVTSPTYGHEVARFNLVGQKVDEAFS